MVSWFRFAYGFMVFENTSESIISDKHKTR